MTTGTITERPPNCTNLTCGECFRCHIASVNVSPSAMPTRYNTGPAGTRQFNNNSWERGVATHPSGMPYLDGSLSPIGLHQWQSIGSRYEKEFSAERAAGASPPPSAPAVSDPATGALT